MVSLNKNQSGMVSLTIVGILMIVISITVLGFAQLIRREQRQALDKQLSSQAYYAAESAVNAARTYIQNEYIQTGAQIVPKTTCKPVGGDPYDVLSGELDAETNTSYPCLLIDSAPKTLVYQLQTSKSSRVIPLDTGTGTVDKITFSWTPSTQASPLTGCNAAAAFPANSLTPSTGWPCNGYGILRIDLVPVSSPFNRDTLRQKTFTAFMTPRSTVTPTPSTVTYNAVGVSQNIFGGDANQGAMPTANCDTTSCKITVTGLSGNGTVKYYVRVMPMYRDTTLTLSAQTTSNVDLPLEHAQVLIDATGKASDVLRRIQVRMPLVSDGLHPDYGILSTDSMCKQLITFPDKPIAGIEC